MIAILNDMPVWAMIAVVCAIVIGILVGHWLSKQ